MLFLAAGFGGLPTDGGSCPLPRPRPCQPRVNLLFTISTAFPVVCPIYWQYLWQVMSRRAASPECHAVNHLGGCKHLCPSPREREGGRYLSCSCSLFLSSPFRSSSYCRLTLAPETLGVCLEAPVSCARHASAMMVVSGVVHRLTLVIFLLSLSLTL